MLNGYSSDQSDMLMLTSGLFRKMLTVNHKCNSGSQRVENLDQQIYNQVKEATAEHQTE